MGLERFRIDYNKRGLTDGVVLLLLGLLVPVVINESGFGIYESLRNALDAGNPQLILLVATKLVLLNSIRAVPHYMGAFLISESVKIFYHGKRRFIFNIVLTFFTIWLVYVIIGQIYPFHYHFGIPAMLIVAFVLILSYTNLFSVSWISKLVLLVCLLMSVQWLDVIPQLSGLGIGRGELSQDTKMFAEFLGYSKTLGWYAVSMLLAFMVCVIIQVQLLYKEHKLRIAMLEIKQAEKKLIDSRVNALRLRSMTEVQSLVHDLKTPLTTIQGLVTLSEMMEKDGQILAYLRKISGSVEAMSSNISEILHRDSMQVFTTEELMKTVLKQISINVPAEKLRYQNDCETACLLGNRIYLSRAVINLIDNAQQAIDGTGGLISVTIYRQGAWIAIEVRDNGKGISDETLQKIWQPGYSQNQSTGLGLSFTRQVIKDHKGSIKIQSRLGRYTQIQILLKEVPKDDGDQDHSGD